MYVYICEVNRVIDGDTVVATMDLGFHVFTKQHLRLEGIDTYELRGEQREFALEEKKYLESLISNMPLTVETKKTGKYGRWIATLYRHPPGRPRENINYLMEIKHRSL